MGEGAALGPLRTTLLHPLEGWPRRVDETATAFVLVLCPGCSWREGGGGEEEENEEEEGCGGWVGEQDFRDWAAGWAVPSLWGRGPRMPGWVSSWALERLGRRYKL